MLDTSTTSESKLTPAVKKVDVKTELNWKTVIENGTKVVTPSWPLQSIVAVNPFWNYRSDNYYESLSQISDVFGQSLFQSIDTFRNKYRQGLISNEAIQKSLDELKTAGLIPEMNLAKFLRESEEANTTPLSFATYSEFLDKNLSHHMTRRIIDEISKYCASYFDQGQALFSLANKQKTLYQEWSSLIQIDFSFDNLGFPRPEGLLNTLPNSPQKAIELCSNRLGLNSEHLVSLYVMKSCHKLIGWGSHINYHHWQASLGLQSKSRGTEIDDIVAIFMLYECWIKSTKPDLDFSWSRKIESQETTFASEKTKLRHHYQLLSVWQRANEWNYQKHVGINLRERASLSPSIVKTKKAQMVFCIDVRSEVIRRKIETELPDVSTHGFAGFFGVSLNCKSDINESVSYRCPVLLTPKISIAEKANPQEKEKLEGGRSFSTFLNGLKQGIASSFVYVEFFGVFSGFNILKNALGKHGSITNLYKTRFNRRSVIMSSLEFEGKLATANFALTHMGIREFAPVVFICGHGSATTNNALGASLDCGACGGHSGELNARVLCEILNDSQVRSELKKAGQFNIPENTQFVPALHETVTDQILFLEDNTLSSDTLKNIESIKDGLNRSSNAAQEERAKLTKVSPPKGDVRSANWAEVRPEWALVRNACFIVAPRERTLGKSLSGRSFLHDYDYTQDDGMKTLELIMTAPMVVTNWINMQYYASSVAMNTFGSGNKTIQNIVGRFGVVEGNGGDLRIGLPLQSVHDGESLVHEPLRLSVFIDAPRAEIEKIIEKHQVVKDLVNNQWLHIFEIDRKTNSIHHRTMGGSYQMI